MLKYVFKRLAYIVIVFLIASVLLFALYNGSRRPGPMMFEGKKASMKPGLNMRRYQDAVPTRLDQTVSSNNFTWLFQYIAIGTSGTPDVQRCRKEMIENR